MRRKFKEDHFGESDKLMAICSHVVDSMSELITAKSLTTQPLSRNAGCDLELAFMPRVLYPLVPGRNCISYEITNSFTAPYRI